MRAGGALVIAAIAATASLTSADARPGRVVKVDRKPVAAKKQIAVCEARRSRVTCYGPVEAGDELHGLTETGDYTRWVVRSTGPSRDDECNTGTPIDVTADAHGSQAGRLALAGIDVEPGRSKMLDRRGLKPPAAVGGEQMILAADLDGDGGAELLATMRSCNELRAGAGLSSRRGESFCVTFWTRPRLSVPWAASNRVELHSCR